MISASKNELVFIQSQHLKQKENETMKAIDFCMPNGFHSYRIFIAPFGFRRLFFPPADKCISGLQLLTF